MLEINVIKEKPQEIIQRLAIKNIDATATINKILELDAQRRETQKKLDDYLSELNQINKEIGILF
ncbi:MAG TPA: serine--tRNA ligase, partial [Bacteroidales bacterium]|nr:serine--tRNA ligase [Bacteroidales bacterium]